MDQARGEIWLDGLSQLQLDWLLKKEKVPLDALLHPLMMTATRGRRAHDGRFDYDPRGEHWLAFEEDEDFVFWRPGDELATSEGLAFALGEDLIFNAGSYAFDGWLSVFPDPLSWLKAGRKGIVIIDWGRVFDRLRDCPRIVCETRFLAERIDTLMHPARLPAIAVRAPKKTITTRRGRE